MTFYDLGHSWEDSDSFGESWLNFYDQDQYDAQKQRVPKRYTTTETESDHPLKIRFELQPEFVGMNLLGLPSEEGEQEVDEHWETIGGTIKRLLNLSYVNGAFSSVVFKSFQLFVPDSASTAIDDMVDFAKQSGGAIYTDMSELSETYEGGMVHFSLSQENYLR